ncbi:apolipoprotein N-acyltransferase [Hippea maritima]|uniref:Apolipoprotein N-acyltransferase n=1 Tax=Hippea maritima (strain ATCC 700847 / DSM 10411 / MH2) TaxID=760142 RepID=F2LUZ8_HIPMA|nr:apolipoprotein N-acyltransferase [Hippea maritima]AEA33582.1 Apolipoprotein N-acyltransferase [Hippea maritima DSM 10411]
MLDKLYNKTIYLASLPLIAAFFFSWLSFIAFIPFLYFLEKRPIKSTIFTFLPFLAFIYSGIYKSTHVYYGLNAIFALLLVIGLSIYHLFYLASSAYVFKKIKSNLLIFPILFVAFEVLKNKALYGLPLGNLNIFTYNLPFFIKDASIFGSMFVDLKILYLNLALLYLLKKEFKKSAVLAGAIFLSILIPTTKPISFKHISISLVQGNIPQDEKWENNLLSRNLNIYLSLSKGLKSDVVFWPESAYPYLFSKIYSKKIENLIHSNSFSLIFGAVIKDKEKYYNSVVLYSKNQLNYYNKQKLVPFAEFMPFSAILKMENYNLTEGKKNVIFKTKGVNIGPMVCYEENYPSISRLYKTSGIDILTVFTNDAWFDKTPTFYLFPRSDIYRAVENKTMLIRIANTGLSFIVAPDGKILNQLPTDKIGVLTTQLNIPLYTKTVYDRFGWLFDYLIVLFATFLPFYRRYKSQKQTQPH